MNYKNERERESSERREIKEGNEADKNRAFFGILDSKYEQERVKDTQKFKEMMQAITQKLKQLQSTEKQEWARYLELKCVQLRNQSKVHELQSHIRRLIYICNQLKIQYSQDLIQVLIKPIFYEKYGEQMLQMFKKAGYSTEQYQFLNYTQSWFSKFWNFFSSD